MDALDEFFDSWCEPEAWCEMCGDHPAVHIVLRDTEGKYGGIMSHVRVWNPETQSRIPVCRQCCAHHVDQLGQEQAPQHVLSDALQKELSAIEAPTRLTIWQRLDRAVTYGQRVMRRALQHLGLIRR